MSDFKMIRQSSGAISHYETSLKGIQLLQTAKMNKDCAFSAAERETFQLQGLLPAHIETLDEQTARAWLQYQEQTSHLAKNTYLNCLHDSNETLFYKLVSEHLEEMLPIIYTPTVGEAVKRFSISRRRPKGLYISYQDKHRLRALLDQAGPAMVDLAVITDGEAVLGIGDQGVGGIHIANAKLMVYTLCASINPHRTLPIQLDLGTNNPLLLDDPFYLGWRHERITDQAYEDFIATFVDAITQKYPGILLHWEDIGRDHARNILDQYRHQTCTFNGDIQGTGVIALATVLAGIQASGLPLAEHRIVIFGAGTAGVGIADQLYAAFRRTGISEEVARAAFWLVDRPGLLTDAVSLLSFQQPYARHVQEVANWSLEQPNHIGLFDVIKHIKPTVLIGCSTVAQAFTEKIVTTMAAHVERPIILPLSNPTHLAEATPEDLIRYTQGRALIATGSPFSDVQHQGCCYRIAQSNNALAFPGIGLGVIAAKARIISDDMLWAATEALRICSPIQHDAQAALLPKLANTQEISQRVAFAVANQARAEGLATIPSEVDLTAAIQKITWKPVYYPYQAESAPTTNDLLKSYG